MNSLESVELKALVGFCILQKLSWQVSFYLLLPIPVMTLALRNETQGPTPLTFGWTLIKLISLGFLLHAALSQNNGKTMWKFYIKTIMILILAVFPSLTPSVGNTDNRLFLLGFLFTISRSILVKCKLTLADKLAAGIALLNAIFCVHNHVNNQELPECHLGRKQPLISWFVHLLNLCHESESKPPKRHKEGDDFLFTPFMNIKQKRRCKEKSKLSNHVTTAITTTNESTTLFMFNLIALLSHH
ncbi:hypothetical protein GQX74_014921 [Glossina fuscipes]|nr:hypothetical protein GQX74_014921 [Glossina fuscipes]